MRWVSRLRWRFCIYLRIGYDRRKKHVFITGGGSGVGYACVAQFSEKKVMLRLPNGTKKDFSGGKEIYSQDDFSSGVDDINRTVAFLCGRQVPGITGVNLPVYGGLHLRQGSNNQNFWYSLSLISSRVLLRRRNLSAASGIDFYRWIGFDPDY